MRGWLEHKLGHPLDLGLASLQIASIAAAVAAIIASIALYHHYSDEYVVDFDRYIWSFKVAVPPLLVFLSTYVIAFLAGSALSEAPRLTIRFLKNRFFQSRAAMLLWIASLSLLTFLTAWFVDRTPPPHYEVFIGKVMGGESDSHAIAREELKRIVPLNGARGRQFETALAVFEERRRWNMESKPASVPIAITFVRTLDANVGDQSWMEHPLRKHALAEAYSMWLDAARQLDAEIDGGTLTVRDAERVAHAQRAVALYQEVASSGGKSSTSLMRVSAKHNIGNVFLYSGEYEAAASVFSGLLADDNTWNLATVGNLFACQIRMGKPEEVLKRADEVIARAYQSGRAVREPSTYAGVLEAIGFAHLVKGDVASAQVFFRSAYGHFNDRLTKLNLAMVAALAGDRQTGRRLIATAGFEPVTSDNLRARLGEGKALGCPALIWGLIEDDRPAAAAPYFYGYLGEIRTAAELKVVTGEELGQLKRRVAATLERDASSCGDFYRTPLVRARLGVD